MISSYYLQLISSIFITLVIDLFWGSIKYHIWDCFIKWKMLYKINILIMFILSLLYLVLCQVDYYIQPTIGSRFQRGVKSKLIVSCNNKPKVFQLQEWFSDSVMLSIIHLSSIYHLAILMMVLLLFARWLRYFQATHPNLTNDQRARK